ncbi:MAG: prenyltransferase/squalene oxidase repeat-containing protein [Thermoguttaceae bacterium]|jgi:hypothetical protein
MKSVFGICKGLCRTPFTTLAVVVLFALAGGSPALARDSSTDRVISRGLEWLAGHQSQRIGSWGAQDGRYPTAMTALSGTALLCEGSTPNQGKYAANIRKAVDYLVSHSRTNGLIGDPMQRDDRYTYGHGFSMLFLSQVLGEEEDADRRQELVKVLTKAVEFTGRAQTTAGGWGYVSAKDGNDFDEGSTTITQVQGLRGCRNAGIAVPKELIDRAINYIRKCTIPVPNGLGQLAVQYNSKGGGPRPAISAAAIACLFNAGDYDDQFVPKLSKYCDENLLDVNKMVAGHWEYAHYYYAQVVYREGGKKWEQYRDHLAARIVSQVNPDGCWDQGFMGAVYTTAMNLTILQLDRGALPIYQR